VPFQHRFRGSAWIRPIPDSAQAPRNVLPDHTRHPTAPDVFTPNAPSEIRVIRMRARDIPHPAHDVGAKVRWCRAVVHPDFERAVVP